MSVHTLQDLADRVNGRILGDSSLEIRGASSLANAGPHDITFAVDEKNLKRLKKDARPGACVIPEKLATSASVEGLPFPLVAVADALDAFLLILREFRPQPPRSTIGVSPAAHVAQTAHVGTDTNIYPGVYIDAGAQVGSHCDLYPGVYVGPGCKIGDNCVLHPNVVL
ncbi:MAG: UDP-3-O-(3-hydroxymyristoyl)glucosamine N-acyltransferase, partial [Planctomycetota bacterium]|nr:UDP-3-O-(3-hydroxymyristoyl)glucosamine N-acyltransferase [Planctomycetota bacterium]